MAQLIQPDGKVTEVRPANGRAFTLPELQGFVNGYIELTRTATGDAMIVNEEGKLKGLPLNKLASILHAHPDDPIVGNAIIGTPTEFGEDEEDDE